MIKQKELSNPDSCMNRAQSDEMTFVLLARDEAAPHVIRAWIDKRIELGKNRKGDPQITEALKCAKTMERQRKILRP